MELMTGMLAILWLALRAVFRDIGPGASSTPLPRHAPSRITGGMTHLPTDPMPRLRAIMARLRDPVHGCPWDVEQTFASIAPYTIEEAYEVADAIERGDMEELKGELGDLLFQSVFHAQMAEDEGLFDFDDVARGIGDKMIARHPHVFGDESNAKSADQQVADWESVKAAERAAKARGGVLDDVALGLPALMRAEKLQKRAARVGFDWPEIGQVIDKIAEESRELAEARETLPHDKVAEEMGDLLFVMANLARHLKVDPEVALRAANAKFVRRFQYIEQELAKGGTAPADSTLEEMDGLWNAAKREGL
jgi:ATP diphosphatase